MEEQCRFNATHFCTTPGLLPLMLLPEAPRLTQRPSFAVSKLERAVRVASSHTVGRIFRPKSTIDAGACMLM